MTTKDCDLLIVGGGPTGLSAAINGASEGLDVCLLDSGAVLGGQARESAAIENYPMPLGPHKGVTGETLMQGFVHQARKFGASMFCPTSIAALTKDGNHRVLMSDDRSTYASRSVILGNGLTYRRHTATGLGPLMGRGVFYGVPALSNRVFVHKNIVVVGGANSAGQATLRCAATSAAVKLLVRKRIKDRMSQYLIDRINMMPNVEVVENAEVTSVQGKRRLEGVTLNGTTKLPADFMFIFIGAVPRTLWLDKVLSLSPQGFILTHTEAGAKLPFETSIPGVFAAGDVRNGSTKRISAAIGEGSAALQMVHRYLS